MMDYQSTLWVRVNFALAAVCDVCLFVCLFTDTGSCRGAALLINIKPKGGTYATQGHIKVFRYS